MAMDGSDDYIVDDIVFDDQTLAALDQQEQKYLQQSSVTVIPSIPEGPINKRHKTNSGWTPGIGANLASADNYDDLPEISIQGDGSYGIGSRVKGMNASVSNFAPQQSRYEGSTLIKDSSVKFGQANDTLSRNLSDPQSSGSRLPSSRQTLPTNVGQRQSVQIADRRIREYPAAATRQNPVRNSNELQAQMSELQKQLDELRGENSRMQLALKDAVDAKLAKEGEVSILRKNIEKAAQNHAAQFSQLKVDKEKAELKQIQIRKEMKDEMERLRTQFVFKQQELESTIRKPPGTVRAKKAGREFPSTPLAVPAAMSAWNRGPFQAQGSRRMLDETPIRPSRLAHDPRPSPSKQTRKSPEKTRKVAMLPGFENAFETSTPLRSPKRDKGKGKVEQDFVFGGGISQIPSVHSQPINPGPSQFQPQFICSQNLEQETNSMPLSSGSFVPELSQIKNEDVDVVQAESDEDALEEIETIEPINWKAELCRIMLTHSHPLTGQITLQKLLGSAQFMDSTNNYSASFARILEVIANSARSEDYEEAIHVVCTSLLSLWVALHESQQLQSVSILLNLLTKLVLSFPSCRSILLSSRLPLKDDQSESVIDLICRAILEHLEPTKSHVHGHEFASEALSLLESLCFRVSQESMDKLDALARHKQALMLLLHTSQPTWLLEQTSILLVLLSTYHNLFNALLDCTELHDPTNKYDPTKSPFIERLCSHLIDSNKGPNENFKIYILIFLSQLSIAHSNAYAELVDTYALIPSLVLYSSQLATPLWEDDESLVSSVETTASFIQALNQTTFFLYHLIFETDPCLNVRHKLQQAPHRPFNGIDHIFVVTFGRLSYCDAPIWINPESRQELECIIDIAREILDVVVDGPEGDSVWVAFQTEPDQESAIDEEEMEARLVGADM